MDGGPVATHKGVRVDDEVDSAPRLSGITVADKIEVSRADLICSTQLAGATVNLSRCGKNCGWTHDSTSEYAILLS